MRQDPAARTCPRCGRPLRMSGPERHVARCRATADAAAAAYAAAEGTTPKPDNLGDMLAAAGIKTPNTRRRRW